MGGIPLVALGVRPPQIEDYQTLQARAAGIQNMQGQNALQPGQLQEQQNTLQSQQLQLQQQKQQAQDMQTLRTLAPQFSTKDENGNGSYDFEGFANKALKSGVNPLTVNQLRKENDAVVEQHAKAGVETLNNQLAHNKAQYEIIESIKAIKDPNLRNAAYQTGLSRLKGLGADISKLGPTAPDDDTLSAFETTLGMHGQILSDAKTQAETQEAAGKGAAEQAAAGLNTKKLEMMNNSKPGDFDKAIDSIAPPSGSTAGLNQRTKAAVNVALQRGDTEGAQKAYDAAISQLNSIDKETNPDVMNSKIRLAGAEAQARQSAAQGDPAVAGKMLADGSLTLTELKTRGTTPQFIEQATQAAQKIDPSYKPADEVVAESVAKSQTANQFFGSANSLINKGGTLDQLEQRSKSIPQGQFPVLNSIDDWQKLARGKGPLAAYAATALGVADDYGKVMGGGTASDNARDKALDLFAKAASPEQRADAIAATRDAVTSQRDSRVGKNKFLKRMYGSDPLGGTSSKEIHYKVVNGQLVAQ